MTLHQHPSGTIDTAEQTHHMQGSMLSFNENGKTVALTVSLIHDAYVMTKSFEQQAACRSLLALSCAVLC